LRGPYPIDINGDQFRKGNDLNRKKRVLGQYIADIEFYLDAGINVILIYPVPEAGWNVPNQVIKINRLLKQDGFQEPLPLSTSYDVYLERNGEVLKAFDKIEHANFYPIRSDNLFCNKDSSGRCDNYVDGQMLYMDSHHLSIEGSKRIAPSIVRIMDKIRQKQNP